MNLRKKHYSAPSLDKKLSDRKTARVAHQNGEFDFLMPFQKNLLRTDEVSEIIGRSKQFVRELVNNGKLEAHKDSAFGTRESAAITRRSVILYLAETANYDPTYLVLRIEALLKALNGAALTRLGNSVQTLLHRIS
jgi:hypothetical protein